MNKATKNLVKRPAHSCQGEHEMKELTQTSGAHASVSGADDCCTKMKECCLTELTYNLAVVVGSTWGRRYTFWFPSKVREACFWFPSTQGRRNGRAGAKNMRPEGTAAPKR